MGIWKYNIRRFLWGKVCVGYWGLTRDELLRKENYLWGFNQKYRVIQFDTLK